MTPEAGVLKAVLDLLAAERIFAIRMNTGMFSGEYQGRNGVSKKRFVRFGVPGMADVLAFPRKKVWIAGVDSAITPTQTRGLPLWIECKAPGGKQSDHQRSFQAKVESEGHGYLLASNSDDVLKYLRGQR